MPIKSNTVTFYKPDGTLIDGLTLDSKPTIPTPTVIKPKVNLGSTKNTVTQPIVPVVKAPDDPSNKYNTATGQLNTNYTGYVAPGSANSLMYNSGINSVDQNAIDTINNRNRDLATDSIDPNAVYTDTLSKYQAQIDAINNIYNDQLNNSRIVNAPTYKARSDQNRIGQVMGGISSSPMGSAQTDAVSGVNAKEQAAAEAIINDRRAQEIASIMGQVRASSEASLKEKYEAQKQGSEAVLAEINSRPEKKAARVSTAIKALVAGGHDPSKMSPEELDSFVKGLGVSKGELQSAYNAELQVSADAKTKKEQDAFKALPSSAQEYEYAVKQGYKGSYEQYQTADANRKFKASGGVAEKAPKVYTIKTGDTLYDIAQRSGLKVDALLAVNSQVDPNNLRPGQVINLPTSATPEKAPTNVEVTQFINQQMATPEFKSMSNKQKEDFIRANGGTPSDYDY